jgi:hypothetical protein
LRLAATGTGTELFQEVELTGERRLGSELTVTMTLTNGYPVPIRVACLYEDDATLTPDQKRVGFEERAMVIGETILPGTAGSRPDKEGPPLEISYRFTPQAPGSYFLSCMTPAAPDNGMGMEFTVRP